MNTKNNKQIRKESNIKMMLNILVGKWKSMFNSPSVEIIRDNNGYKIAIEYRFGGKVERKIKTAKNKISFDLFGDIELAYDEQKDSLIIATEGIYVREN